ncbi:MAG: VOC family protein [Alicyclobacillus macrosporangiidus]|uniref:VOC family protein n=1 Tax=Alicyclobacillus macrosporangiidus TaxID=392015 RepID=UPI0026F2B31B|nr:VOC family protein [Alicyclobacillus macrosporangiidus]MCL6599916.1 VOC family protein [Alicyclobacillus macrosporangiidus]
MDLRFDHLIHAVSDPERARQAFADRFGWHTVAGGEHPGFGTYNALAYFGLPYIEWVGVRKPDVAAGRLFGRDVLRALRSGEGPMQFAVRTQDIEGVAARWRRAGLVHEGPVEASRVRPDGVTLRWRMLFPAQEPGGLLLPFVIEWPTPDEVRLADLRQSGLSPDPAGAPRLRAVHAVVRDLARLQRNLAAYFPGVLEPCESSAQGRGVRWPCGEVTVFIWEPADGALRRVLDTVGERPFLAEFELSAGAMAQRSAAVVAADGAIGASLGLPDAGAQGADAAARGGLTRTAADAARRLKAAGAPVHGLWVVTCG